MNENPPLFINRDAHRARLLRYTRKAWDMLPPLPGPRILDIGCGSGLPTIQLARWSKGAVVGLDIDQAALDALMVRAAEEGLEDRVEVRLCSLFNIDLPDERFDIVWAEGALSEIGFVRALREWRRLLCPGGYLVVHDDARDLNRKLGSVTAHGYEMVGHFLLPEDAWWVDYYGPLHEEVREKRKTHAGDPRMQAALDTVQVEIDQCKANPLEFRSAFIVMMRGR
jgi:SAM-dependent methyltransferase